MPFEVVMPQSGGRSDKLVGEFSPGAHAAPKSPEDTVTLGDLGSLDETDSIHLSAAQPEHVPGLQFSPGHPSLDFIGDAAAGALLIEAAERIALETTASAVMAERRNALGTEVSDIIRAGRHEMLVLFMKGRDIRGMRVMMEGMAEAGRALAESQVKTPHARMAGEWIIAIAAECQYANRKGMLGAIVTNLRTYSKYAYYSNLISKFGSSGSTAKVHTLMANILRASGSPNASAMAATYLREVAQHDWYKGRTTSAYAAHVIGKHLKIAEFAPGWVERQAKVVARFVGLRTGDLGRVVKSIVRARAGNLLSVTKPLKYVSRILGVADVTSRLKFRRVDDGSALAMGGLRADLRELAADPSEVRVRAVLAKMTTVMNVITVAVAEWSPYEATIVTPIVRRATGYIGIAAHMATGDEQVGDFYSEEVTKWLPILGRRDPVAGILMLIAAARLIEIVVASANSKEVKAIHDKLDDLSTSGAITSTATMVAGESFLGRASVPAVLGAIITSASIDYSYRKTWQRFEETWAEEMAYLGSLSVTDTVLDTVARIEREMMPYIASIKDGDYDTYYEVMGRVGLLTLREFCSTESSAKLRKNRNNFSDVGRRMWVDNQFRLLD